MKRLKYEMWDYVREFSHPNTNYRYRGLKSRETEFQAKQKQTNKQLNKQKQTTTPVRLVTTER